MKKIVFITIVTVIALLPFIWSEAAKRRSVSESSTFTKAPVGSGWDYQTKTKDGLESSLKSGAIEVRLADSGVRFELPFAKDEITQEGDQVVLRGTAVETRYSAEPNRIKEEIVLSQPPTSNTFTMPLKTRNVDIYLTPQNLPVFFQEGAYQFHIEAPFATDAKGNTTYAARYILQVDGKNITYGNTGTLLGKLEKVPTGTNYQLVLEVDSTWLESASYPVTIDPTITHDLQSEFATGSLDRIKDTGSADDSPALETYYQELGADQYTVGLWHLNESSGNALDSSGNNNTGTPTGTTVVSGLLGNGRSLGGSGNYITVSDASTLDVTGTLTLEAWVKPAVIAEKGILTKGLNGDLAYGLRIDSSSKFGFYLTTNASWGPTGSIASITTPVAGTWYHLVGVYDGGSIRIYVNGVLENQAAYSSGIRNSGSSLYIGRFYDSNYDFNGIIDEVRISNIARTPEEIKAAAQRRPSAVYTSPVIDTSAKSSGTLAWTAQGVATGNGETPYDSTGLVAQWNFNETSGTTTASGGSCGTSCNGTLTNFTSTGSQDAAPLSGWTSVNRRWGTGALIFDGSNDYVAIPDNPGLRLTTVGTIEAWVNPRFAKDSGIIYKASSNAYNTLEYAFFYNVSGTVSLILWSSSSSTTVTTKSIIPINQWTHLSGTWDGSTMRFYLNGRLDNTATQTVNALGGTNSFMIGSDTNGGTNPANWRYFPGSIDTTRIYSRALTADEILSNYNAARLDFQTRTSSDGVNWEMWKPSTSETSLLSLDTDAANWSNASSLITKADYSTWKMEGSGSLKLTQGIPQSDANTVGLWHLDETGGTGAYLKDSSGNNNHGTPTGTSVTNGIAGKARSFNGSSEYVNTGNGINPGTFTIEAWIYVHSFSGEPVIVSKLVNNGTANFRNFEFRFNTNGKLYSHIPNGSSWTGVESATTLQVNTWYHVALTYDGSTAYHYINGIRDANTYSGSYVSTTTNVFIGARPDNGSGPGMFFDGVFDEIKISNTARTYEEITESYRMGRDHRVKRDLSTTDLSSATRLPFWVASDRKGIPVNVTIGESAFANYEADANTVGLWHLEEQSGSGAYLKDSAGTNHGTPTGTTHTQGMIGRARKFNGSSDYVSMADTASLRPTSAITVQAWINPASLSSSDWGPTIVSKYGGDYRGYVLVLAGSSGMPRFSIANPSSFYTTTSPEAITVNTWNHLAGVFDGTKVYIYVNGILKDSQNAPAMGGATVALKIGMESWANAGYFNGIIEEVRIDSIARSAEEIRQAYEIGKRSHQVTIDFAAVLESGNLITASNDLSFTVDETGFGVSAKAGNLFSGDKIIVKENYDGTEYLAQGEVSSVNSSTGAVTVLAWESGSTFPTGGYSVNASVFKWQREYMDLTGSMPHHRDSITKLTLQPLDGLQGGTLWLDDLMTATPYLDTPAGETIPSTLQRYFQYKTVFSTSDTLVSAGLASVSLTYTTAFIPPTNCRIETSAADTLTLRWTDTTTDETGFEIERNVDGAGFSALTTTGADSASYADDTIVSGHTYAYRVRTYKTGDPTEYTAYCTTATSDVSTGLFEVEGLEMEGVDLE